MSARVRDKIREKHNDGALLIYRVKNEQGFTVLSHRDPTTRLIIDIEGLQLVQLR